MLHKILWEEITCVSSSMNTCPITTQTFDNGPVNTGAMNICLSLKYIKQVYYKTPEIKPGTNFNTDQRETMGWKLHALRPASFHKAEFAASFHLAYVGKQITWWWLECLHNSQSFKHFVT